MDFQEITIELAQQDAEKLSDILLEQGALSVSIEDAQSNTPEEQVLFGEPGFTPEHFAWQRSILKVLLPSNVHSAEFIEKCVQLAELPQQPFYQINHLQDQNWVQLTQSQFEPMHIGQHIWVAPSWHSHPTDDPKAITIELDPGLAFGTGSHPTTHLCMSWLETHLAHHQSLLDYGCGSGILAILAKKCGAKTVSGTDIDVQAIEAARKNSLKNKVEIDFFLPSERSTMQYDVVVANILSNPLKLMAPMLSAKVKHQGQLVLSGILERQAQTLIEAYAPWIRLSVWKTLEGWICLTGKKD